MTEKYVKTWRNKIALRKAYNSYTGGSSQMMREAVGNFPRRTFSYLRPGETQNTIYKKLLNNHNALKKYILSKNIHTPTLYKGLKKNEARKFRETGTFSTRALTSASTNRFQASTFSSFDNDPVILVIARGKRPAMIAGHYGIHSRQPREREVTLPPGKFVFQYRNKNTGNYHVNFVPTRSPTSQ